MLYICGWVSIAGYLFDCENAILVGCFSVGFVVLWGCLIVFVFWELLLCAAYMRVFDLLVCGWHCYLCGKFSIGVLGK